MCLVQQFNFRSKVNKARLEFKMAKNVMNEIETWTSIYLEMLYIYTIEIAVTILAYNIYMDSTM